MKIQLETIHPASNSLLRLLHNPRLNDLFYWHFHPEYEIVFIEGASATRHVGNHISSYKDSDLVLIGSNIPHLNFDHGVKTDYKKDVLHIKPQFRENTVRGVAELQNIEELFERSAHGVAFSGETKREVGMRMQKLHTLSPFDLYLETLAILKILAASESYELLHERPYVNTYRKKEQARLRSIYAYIDENYQRKISLEAVAASCNLGKEAFCRYFKRTTGNTFVQVLNQYRISQAKRLLMSGKNVSEACYSSGFESLSYFNRTFKKISGENPSEFRNGFFKRRHSA
ncbi:AraC family transcriptional regulator [Poritiphilus flavus]|uniref:Helix-turn-helix domain-containing protein n=1 Tax=Poritiphilus flavus TaxID=2697053 RepID=A0A6L9ECV4_9FLAO|nr:AraC family transcriptional regulator [Poritiphilus flavus]NAS12526.1 helix-turn-helix domain-containing protein [Poritiphilus flavus]